MRYAWAVRAVAYDGMDEMRTFENNGLSEIRWFRVEDYCPPPIDLKVEAKSGRIYLNWIPPIEQSEVTVSYRQTDPVPYNGEFEADWFHVSTSGSDMILYDVRPGATYEYKVATTCSPGFPVYGPTRSITVPPFETHNPNCGVMSEIDISNHERLLTLNSGEMFFAGDFPVYAMEVTSDGNGVFNGTGYMLMSHFFNHIKLRVNLIDVIVNIDRRKIGGIVEGVYNPVKNSIADLGGNVSNNIKIDIKTNFTVSEDFNFIFNTDDNTITVTDNAGNYVGSIDISQIVAERQAADTDIFPVTVEDSQGDVYKLHTEKSVDANGSETTAIRAEKLEEDKPGLMIDRDFLFVTVEGTADTLMDGHTLTMPKRDTPINMEIGYHEKLLYNRAYQSLDDEYRKNTRIIKNRWSDSIHTDRTKWIINSKTVTGNRYEIDQSLNMTKLTINTEDAMPVIFRDTALKRDTLILGNRITGNQMTVNINIANSGILLFKPKNEQYYKDYGFDDAMNIQCQQAGDYETVQISGMTYYVPWLGVLPNIEAEIKLEYKSSNPELDSLILLESDKDGFIFVSNNQSNIELPCPIISNITLKVQGVKFYTVNAYSIQKGNIKTLIGRLKVESQEYQDVKKIRIIRIKRSDEKDYYPFTVSQKKELVNNINEYYKQAFLQFELDNSNYQDTLTIRQTSMEEVSSLNSIYKDLPEEKDKTSIYHIFVSNQVPGSIIEGAAHINSNVSILYQPTALNAIHELGHDLGLQHTFDNKNDGKEKVCIVGLRILPEYSTKNIMDYSYANESDHRYYFFLYQINHLKNK
jgi:hypothetical protein